MKFFGQRIGCLPEERQLLADAALLHDIGYHINYEKHHKHSYHLVQHAERSITLKQFGSGQIVIGGGWPAHLSDKRSHPTVELASLIGNATLAQYMVPKIAPLRIIRTWAGINSKVDGRGVLGAFPGVDGLFIAIPGDAGYTLGPLSARLVADSMLRRTMSEDLTPYSPERFLTAAKYLPSVHD